jgi:hypothetical protein
METVQLLSSEVDITALILEQDQLSADILSIKNWFAETWLPMSDPSVIAQRENYKDKLKRIDEINYIIINH